MIKILWGIIVLLCSISHAALAGTDDFFNVTISGAHATLNINLCSNGKGPLTCQSYTVTGQTLSIRTLLANQAYPIAGIRINTPGYAPTSCTPISNGYYFFQ
ncbi:MAG: hypothetical protein PSV35_00025 [bacterium]|nr:hypothetical protein [bacterium]